MIRSTANLKVRNKMRKKRTLRPKPNVTRLNSLQVQQDLELASPNPDDVEVKWEKFRNIVCDTSVEHLGGGGLSTASMNTGSMRIMQSCGNSLKPGIRIGLVCYPETPDL